MSLPPTPRLPATTPAKSRPDSQQTKSQVSVSAIATSLKDELDGHSGELPGLWEILVGSEEDTEWADGQIALIKSTEWGRESAFRTAMTALGYSRYQFSGSELLKGSLTDWKPDVVLLRTKMHAPSLSQSGYGLGENRDPVETWTSGATSERRVQQVLSPGELKFGDPSLRTKAHTQILGSLYILMTNQPGRLFVIGFTVVNQSFALYLAHSNGVFWSPSISAADNPRKIGHLLWKLTQMTSLECGLIPQLSPLDVLEPNHVAVIDKEFAIERVLLHRRTIVGRGAVVLLLSRSTGADRREHFVLKLHWYDQLRGAVEDKVLATIAIAREKASRKNAAPADVEIGETAAFHDEPTLSSTAGLPSTYSEFLPFMQDAVSVRTSTTQTLFSRGSISLASSLPATVAMRSFASVRLQPAGQHLEYFCSDVNLVGAFIDAVKAHRNLHNLGYLHKDVSVSNVLLGLENPEQGLLIDFDLAAEVDGAASSTSAHRTGTLPFMALAVLKSERMQAVAFKHEVDHDLESFFWVLLWMCLKYEGPSPTKGFAAITCSANTTELQLWNSNKRASYNTRWAFLTLDWEDTAKASFPSYWKPTYEFVLTPLREFFCDVYSRSGRTQDIGYDAVLKVLEDGKRKLEKAKLPQ